MNKCWSGCGKGGNCLWECKLMRSLRRRVHCYCSVTRLCLPLSPHELQHNRLSSAISLRLLKLMFIESVMPSNQLILCHPLLLPPSIFPRIRVFSNEHEVFMSQTVIQFFKLKKFILMEKYFISDTTFQLNVYFSLYQCSYIFYILVSKCLENFR